jgi:hypothetical protein
VNITFQRLAPYETNHYLKSYNNNKYYISHPSIIAHCVLISDVSLKIGAVTKMKYLVPHYKSLMYSNINLSLYLFQIASYIFCLGHMSFLLSNTFEIFGFFNFSFFFSSIMLKVIHETHHVDYFNCRKKKS